MIDNGPSVHKALETIPVAFFWKAIAWVVATAASIIAVLLGWDRKAMKEDIKAIYDWKDRTVDKALREMPGRYLDKKDLTEFVTRPNNAAHDAILGEIRAVRALIESHLDKNGKL